MVKPDISKLLRFIVGTETRMNRPYMSFTPDVSKEDKSNTAAGLENLEFENINRILVNSGVVNELKSRLSILFNPLNMLSIVLTFPVSNVESLTFEGVPFHEILSI